MSLAGKVALVTGSTSGIGLAIARAFVAAGAKVMLNGFGDPKEIDSLKEELGAGHDATDLGDVAAIERNRGYGTWIVDRIIKNQSGIAGRERLGGVGDFSRRR